MVDVRLLNESNCIRTIPSGQKITLREGGAPEMYIVLTGVVEVTTRSNNMMVPTGTINAGGVFGEKQFFGDDKNSQSFKANTNTSVYVITKDIFLNLAKNKPQVIYEIMQTLCVPSGNSAQQTATSAPATPITPATPAAPTPPPPVIGGENSTIITCAPDFFPEGHKGYPGITHPEYKKYIHDKEYKCTNCQKTFKGSRIFQSKLVSAAPTRFDMRESYVDFQTEWYDVVTCPLCYFSALANSFTDTTHFFRMRAQSISKTLAGKVALDFDAERDIDFVLATHFLALAYAPSYTNQRLITAKLWSNISWLYEDTQDEEMTKYAALMAAQAFETIFSETTLSPAQEQTTCLAAAGMLYRAGKTDNIRKLLYTVKTNRAGKRLYADLADDLLDKLHETGEL